MYIAYFTNTIPLLLKIILLQSTGRGHGRTAACALSYASDGGAARICQRGAKARERNDRAGEGVEGGFPLPR